jgi:DMSO/TMAO reductase YedYZ molybdopterin-dependent catalytic subunit
MIARRTLLAGLPLLGAPARSAPLVDPLQGKAGVLRRRYPPLLETPLSALDAGPITANAPFFVRWHYPVPAIDPASWFMVITGHVARTRPIRLADLARLPQHEVVAVNQCAGNGRALSAPPVPGAQWGQGAIGNARWRGPRLADVLALAGPRAGARAVRFTGLDEPAMPGAPPYAKALAFDHAREAQLILATHMNGEALPLAHGAPVRLVVPGWYSTYWVKSLGRIELLDTPDTSHWMANAYRVPEGASSRPVSAMGPQSLITSPVPGTVLPASAPFLLRGLAMGGDAGVAAVHVSADGGEHWQPARLGADLGRYSFRAFEARLQLPPGRHSLLARATSASGAVQPLVHRWNPGGFERQAAEPVPVEIS